jgi:flagellar basal body-associated protein FliL
MNYEELFWVAMAVLVIVLMPVALAVTLWQILRGKKQGKNRTSTGRAMVAIGNALQELDRLVARPSVEFKVEAGKPMVKSEDDKGGD